jgi:phospholipid-binding lipoprotein MlaA
MESTPPTPSRRRSPRALALAALLALAPLSSLAGTPGDPLEKLNRATFAFNDALDRMLARPAARAYVKIVPSPIRTGVSNFVGNLSYPEVIVNDVLQGKFKDAGSDIARLLINTTVGIAGLGDPATRWGFQSHDEDFGQTLGHWGVKPGPYLVVPVLGPSDFRDAPAKLVDAYGDAYTYFKSTDAKYGLYLLTQFNKRVDLLAADSALKNAFDPYVFVRNAYVARRNYLVHDGNVPEDNFDDPMSALPSATDGEMLAMNAVPEPPSVTTETAWVPGTRALTEPAITSADAPATNPAEPAPVSPSNP